MRKLITLSAALLLVACGGGDTTADDVAVADRADAAATKVQGMETMADTSADKGAKSRQLVGEWGLAEDMVMEAGGMTTTISDMVVTYKGNGTAESRSKLTMEGMPGGTQVYNISTQSKYSMADGMIKETITDYDVKAGPGGDASMADMMKSGMPAGMETTGTIVSLDRKELVVSAEGTDQAMRLVRR